MYVCVYVISFGRRRLLKQAGREQKMRRWFGRTRSRCVTRGGAKNNQTEILVPKDKRGKGEGCKGMAQSMYT